MSSLSTLPLSVLDLAPIRAGGSAAETFRNSVHLAQETEALGFNRYWLAEHHNISGIASAATSVLIGHIAQQTTHMRIGSGGIMLPNHPPLVIAEQFGTLATLYPDRIDLGLGRAPGSDGATMHAMRRAPQAGVDDFPDQLAELQRYLGTPEPGQRVQAIPGQDTHVPVWLLGSSGYSAQLAGRLGLPFAFAGQFAPGYMYEALDLYRTNFRPSHVLSAPYAMLGIPMIVAETDERAQWLATTQQQKFLNLIRGQTTRLQPPVDTLDWLPHERIAVERHLGASIVGSPETARAQLKQLIERTQINELMINTDAFDMNDRLNSYRLLAKLRE
ncbi:LLM class flavin-dependent oxidoreductase [Larsenimonas suaedae]|uniref:LLM class flavin-dependent oxidoreductase n=1 Tax=Larsenimonas suaedae TaxID=1851019 RepID=A0ABU1GST6_9GAMM|nr:LLM class flavin-dependent oxidoreductase [Larsenimonas suaedae]MCM2972160.1 LLM class flavin-dependent oxidoreductase [Larsenimonas suaedae]MDR5895044.1 LLM class flavin-dependent oxidoreductase [Larsenimonas suaedae]